MANLGKMTARCGSDEYGALLMEARVAFDRIQNLLGVLDEMQKA